MPFSYKTKPKQMHKTTNRHYYNFFKSSKITFIKIQLIYFFKLKKKQLLWCVAVSQLDCQFSICTHFTRGQAQTTKGHKSLTSPAVFLVVLSWSLKHRTLLDLLHSVKG